MPQPIVSILKISCWSVLLAGLLLLVSRCDSIVPDTEALLVVEGYLDAGKPLPLISLRKAQSLSQSANEASTSTIIDAEFRLILDRHTITYRPSVIAPGKYEPVDAILSAVPARSRFRVEIDWQDRHATTEDIIPPPIKIDSVRLSVPDAPVTAILIDTLRLDTPQVGARKGFIYPIEVTVWWTNDFEETGIDSTYWIEARLRPDLAFSSKVLDVFLLSEAVQAERTIPRDTRFRRSWTGVYAVPVADSLATAPPHSVSVQLLRGSQAYARFASSRNVPERREPISNIDGAIGILAGISLDTLTVEVVNGAGIPKR